MKSNLNQNFIVEHWNQRRGAMLILIAAMMSLFLIAVVFTVDVAYMQLIRTELRVTADAAAKAAMESLIRTESEATAKQTARDIAALNPVGGQAYNLVPADISFGSADPNADGSWSFNPDGLPRSAVKVDLRLDGRRGNNPASLFFAGFLGHSDFTPTQSAIAGSLVHEIVLCIDRSHSMCFDLTGVDYAYPPGTAPYPNGYYSPPNLTGSRWAKLDSAIEAFVTKIQQRSIKPDIGLVTWGSDITVSFLFWSWSFDAVTRNLELGQNINSVNGEIDNYYDGMMQGSTNMAAGLDEAISMLTDGSTHSLAQKTIILMSDGQWNQGNNPTLSAQTAANNDIIIHTISFVTVSNQSTMQTIADMTGGRHYSATDLPSLQAAFEELAENLPVVLIE